MRPETEQIEAILSERTFKWAQQQLPPGKAMGDMRFSDFISVTPEQAERYVEEHGFPAPNVYEEGGQQPWQSWGQLCMERYWLGDDGKSTTSSADGDAHMAGSLRAKGPAAK